MTADRPAGRGQRDPARSADHRDTLQRLAEAGGITSGVDSTILDARTAALACLAATVAMGAAPRSYRRGADLSLAAGASVDDVVGTLKVVARTAGLARVVSAAPGLALGVGYDVDAAFESVDDRPGDGDELGLVPVVEDLRRLGVARKPVDGGGDPAA